MHVESTALSTTSLCPNASTYESIYEWLQVEQVWVVYPFSVQVGLVISSL